MHLYKSIMWDTCTFVLRDSSYQTTYGKFGYGNRLHVVVSCKIHSSSFPCTTVTLYICNVYMQAMQLNSSPDCVV